MEPVFGVYGMPTTYTWCHVCKVEQVQCTCKVDHIADIAVSSLMQTLVLSALSVAKALA